jgi:hypothetical protein
MDRENSSPGRIGVADTIRPASRRSGRMYEIPLVFMGSTMLLALAFPYVSKPEHGVLLALSLGGYGAVQMLLLWVVKGWGRMAALLLIGVGAAAWPWVALPTRPVLALSMPALFMLGWCGDWWLRRRAAARPPETD